MSNIKKLNLTKNTKRVKVHSQKSVTEFSMNFIRSEELGVRVRVVGIRQLIYPNHMQRHKLSFESVGLKQYIFKEPRHLYSSQNRENDRLKCM